MNLHALLANTASQGQPETGARRSAEGTQAGSFSRALGQATASGAGHLERSRPAADPGNAASAQRIDRQLEALGLSKAQRQSSEIQALMEHIRQHPEMAQALQTLADTLSPGTPQAAPALSGNTPELNDIAQRLDLLAEFSPSAGSDSQAAQWREALDDLLQSEGDGSPAAPLAGLLAAMTQTAGGSDKALPTQSSGLSVDALLAQGNSQPRQAGDAAALAGRPAETAALASALASASQTSQDGAISVSASPLNGTALRAALTTASDAAGHASPQALTGALASAGGNSAAGMAGAPAQASVAAPLGSPAWPQQLGQQLAQFSRRGGEQQVQLQIHPAELGPLSVSLKVSEHGGTQAHFLSSHAQVRQVVEQAIPQLREALAEQGIALGNTSVGEQTSGDEPAFANGGQPGTAAGSGADAEGAESLEPATRAQTLAVDGRVDLYA
ncbi:hypothetical protein GCM10022228_12290 [Halomonas cibimaris]|uniref:Flagellar hook-length control protein-like C-terminal domain-containing protein n=1 Tax=Halomonas cibimaris TaxID=657012 RepID=A0ABP7LPZ9_9GAMM